MSGNNNYNDQQPPSDPDRLAQDASRMNLGGQRRGGGYGQPQQQTRQQPQQQQQFYPQYGQQQPQFPQYGGGGAGGFRPNPAATPSFTPGASAFTPRGTGNYQEFTPGGGYGNQYGQPGYGQYQNNYGGGYNQEPAYNANGYNNNYQQDQGRTLTLDEYAASKKSSNLNRPLNTTASTTKTSTAPSSSSKPASQSTGGPKVIKIGGPSVKAEKTGDKTIKIVSSAPPSNENQSKPSTKEEKLASGATTPTVSEPDQSRSATPKKEKAAVAAAAAASTGAESEKRETDEVLKEQAEDVDDEVVQDLYGKEHLSVIFMGHVDAGKSTMGGNILYLTGAVDKRTMEKYEREAKEAGRENWYLSWALDINKEERDKGKTVEVGRANFETDKRRFTILDAPGHKTYVPSMIGGASQADIGILVISARKGEYETGFERGGQTREHAMLARNQGINKLVLAVNKMDDPTVNWSKQRYDECITKIQTYLKALGYKPEEVTCIPVSAQTGVNLKDRVSKKICPWYNGPSLLEFLENVPTTERKTKAPFMMPVNGKYKDLGTIVEGKIESGSVKVGSQLMMMPNKHKVEVATIYTETEAESPAAICGEQVKLRIKGVEEEEVQVGFVLTSISNPVHAVTAFEAQVAIVELKSILSAGYSCVMHVHSAIEEVTFTALLHKLEKSTNRKSKKPPAFATRGMKIIARLESSSGSPFCLERFEDYPQLGRFTLRDQGTTIAIGKVTKLITE